MEDVIRPLLRGHGVVLEPLTLAHAPELFAIARPEMFGNFLSWPEVWTMEAFGQWLGRQIGNPKSSAFAVRDDGAMKTDPRAGASEPSLGETGLSTPGVSNWAGKLVGATSFCDIDLANKALEVGWTWYTPPAQGTLVNPACKLLLLEHAFEKIKCVRVQLKCDLRNLRSQAAIAKLGATREGVLRQHRIQQNGFVRDTVMYSITAVEWPAIKHGLASRLNAGR